MSLTLQQIVQDLEKAKQPPAVAEKMISSVRALANNVRKIRAMTDEVMDARVRIDEMLEQTLPTPSECVD
ncbi:hypothetical protein GGI20_002048 [Coemansia sp. BCRC 34301]|nr:hypothetical protein GGI20_002048 [Coemansia sp. BCRC 34301]